MTLKESEVQARQDRLFGWLLRIPATVFGLILIFILGLKITYQYFSLHSDVLGAAAIANVIANLYQLIPTVPFWWGIFPDPDVRSILNASNLGCAIIFLLFTGVGLIGDSLVREGKALSRAIARTYRQAEQEGWSDELSHSGRATTAEISVRVLPFSQQDKWHNRPVGRTGLAVLGAVIAGLVLRHC